MSEAYERERQNNSRIDELAGKISALRGVTVDIYDNARSQEVIDHSVRRTANLSSGYSADKINVTVRDIRQPLAITQGQRLAHGPHGAERQQDGHIQAERYYCCGRAGPVLCLQGRGLIVPVKTCWERV